MYLNIHSFTSFICLGCMKKVVVRWLAIGMFWFHLNCSWLSFFLEEIIHCTVPTLRYIFTTKLRWYRTLHSVNFVSNHWRTIYWQICWNDLKLSHGIYHFTHNLTTCLWLGCVSKIGDFIKILRIKGLKKMYLCFCCLESVSSRLLYSFFLSSIHNKIALCFSLSHCYLGNGCVRNVI